MHYINERVLASDMKSSRIKNKSSKSSNVQRRIIINNKEPKKEHTYNRKTVTNRQLGLQKQHFSRDKQYTETSTDVWFRINALWPVTGDPVPVKPTKDGLVVNWRKLNYVNPPFELGRDFVLKAIEEAKKGRGTLMLIPTRTNLATRIAYESKYCTAIYWMDKDIRFKGFDSSLRVPIQVIAIGPVNFRKDAETKLMKKELLGNKYEVVLPLKADHPSFKSWHDALSMIEDHIPTVKVMANADRFFSPSFMKTLDKSRWKHIREGGLNTCKQAVLYVFGNPSTYRDWERLKPIVEARSKKGWSTLMMWRFAPTTKAHREMMAMSSRSMLILHRIEASFFPVMIYGLGQKVMMKGSKVIKPVTFLLNDLEIPKKYQKDLDRVRIG